MLVHGMEGGEIKSRNRYMLSVSLPSSTIEIGGSSVNCFIKDGRKISVGECALCKPAQDSPPFVGIIRPFTSDKESHITVGVNWLYRPAEVKLLKGVALEAEPNEVFYSFHRDEIPAASLVHYSILLKLRFCLEVLNFQLGFLHLSVVEFMTLQTSVCGGLQIEILLMNGRLK